MIKSLSDQLARGAALIADDRLAAGQLEAFLLASGAIGTDQRAWRSPNVKSQAAWLTEFWSRYGDDRLPIGRRQSVMLWQRVIRDSPDGGGLIDTVRVAELAAAAWRLLWDWRVGFRNLRAESGDPAFASFLRWAQDYEHLLHQNAWVDPSQLPCLIADIAGAGSFHGLRVVFAPTQALSPAIQNLVATLRRSGCEIDVWSPPPARGRVGRAAFQDLREEMIAAATWAVRQIRSNPRSRVALVVPPGSATDDVLERAFRFQASRRLANESEIQPVWLAGQQVSENPALGAALTSLELWRDEADFHDFSRWLRSPFLGHAELEDRSARCAAEAALRSELMAQLNFVPAYRDGGLRAWLLKRLPRLVDCVDSTRRQIESLPQRQSPTRWAEAFDGMLARLGWPGIESRISGDTVDTWSRLLTELTLLTPVVSDMSLDQALDEIRSIVESARESAPTPPTGVSVLAQSEQLGPGYDAVWVAGMSDRAWPRAARPNPLLPRSLQVANGMPFASPDLALGWCRETTARLAAQIPELVFSHSMVEDDNSVAPSPLIRRFAPMELAVLPRDRQIFAHAGEAGNLERCADSIPALDGKDIVGGSATLAVQARCPLKAFIESRLLAKPLEPIARGIGARYRGIATHRALELLFKSIRSRDDLAATARDEVSRTIDASVTAALEECTRGASRSLRVYLRLEQRRLGTLLEAMIEEELARSEFEIVGLEVKHVGQLAGYSVACRIDRIDTLADGRIAIIDYKTGSRGTPADWLRPRLLEPQLPLYAEIVGNEIGALVLARFRATGFAYRGIWDVEDAFPARSQALPPDTNWESLQARWAEQLEILVTEYAAGDGRIFQAEESEAAGPYAPLTRVYERSAWAYELPSLVES